MRGRAALVGLTALATMALGCSNDGGTSPPDAAPTTTTSSPTPAPETTPTTTVQATASLQVETAVEGAYRQGLARVDDGWIFSTNDTLFRTDDALNSTGVAEPAIPKELRTRDFDHIGDIDLHDGVVYAPVERSDHERGEQVMARYVADTLGVHRCHRCTPGTMQPGWPSATTDHGPTPCPGSPTTRSSLTRFPTGHPLK